MLLIRITTQPIQYRYEIERARLEGQGPKKPEGKITTEPSSLEINSKDIKVNLNTDAMFESIGLRKIDSWAKEYANRGFQKAQEGMGEQVRFGNDMSRIYDHVTIAQIVQSRVNHNFPLAVHTFSPSAGPEITWDPAELDMNYTPEQVNIDWDITRNPMTYIPGKFSMEILQYPKVNIEYIGGFNYFPPSADPDYEETIA